MSLVSGKQFGHYLVGDVVGEGGMGQVYRATDTTLDREVAIKVLPESFAADSDRIARFEREALTLASLNHPNIGMIFGLERREGVIAIVMELVEGPTLEDLIKQGPLPPDEALRIARQIINGLEAAHDKGIVHRDLKPANIKVKEDGSVKILDFGIAKPAVQGSSGGGATPTMITPAVTETGIIMGTAAYMSPEQARGRFVDQRTDIWAFGCVLYEMLTGQPAFGGEDVTVTLARIIERVADMTFLPDLISPAVRHTLKLCLEKDPKKRIADIRDVKLALEGAFDSQDATQGIGQSAEPRSRTWGIAAVAALVSGLVVASLVWSFVPRTSENIRTTRFIVRTPEGEPLSTIPPVLALSANGRDLVYAVGQGLNSQLFHQSLEDFEAQAIDGSLGAVQPVFMPGGDAVGFRNDPANLLQRVDISGGRATRLLADAFDGPGKSMAADGTLVFSPDWNRPLRVLRPGAAEPVDLTRININAQEISHLWPEILPDNHSVLFTIWSGAPSWDEAELAIANLQTGEHSVILRGAAFGRYATSGHLVFWRGNSLMAVPFNLDTLSITGEAVRVVQDVRLGPSNGGADFAISTNGTLAYVEGEEENFSETFIVDRAGRLTDRLGDDAAKGQPVFSPDGRKLALTLYRGGAYGIGVYDLDRTQLTPVMNRRGDHTDPTWTPDGNSLTFTSNTTGEYNLFTVRADGSGLPEPLLAEAVGYTYQMRWSGDGRYLVYGNTGAESDDDIWVFEPAAGVEPQPLLATAASERSLSFSPDGAYIVYSSNESGASEIYVRTFPDVEARRILISQGGGIRPRWSRDGTEIFYASDLGLMRVPVTASGTGDITFGQPSLLFEMSFITTFDVAPDGQSFAIERVPIETAANEIHIVQNWFEELNRLVPTK